MIGNVERLLLEAPNAWLDFEDPYIVHKCEQVLDTLQDAQNGTCM